MRTTLKRGVGRGAHLNGRGRAVLPPASITPVTRYEQPPREPRSGLAIVGRILLVTLLTLISAATALAGGSYLYFHQSVAAVRAHTPDVKRAQKQLAIVPPGHAAIALVIGYDHRAGIESGLESRSDTIMLLRADPQTKTISMLSFPRDLQVTVKCRNLPDVVDRINYAYQRCGSDGTLRTVQALTQLPVNYLITVNFHGFKQIVDKLGGVWMDVDRRYYNRNVGTAETNFADINLQPGYQRLNATQALEFVRYRHTDSDFYRLARQQQFVRAFKEQVASNSKTDLALKLPGLVSAVTNNVEVGVGGGGTLKDKTVLSYALFGVSLPPGHFFQPKIENLGQDAFFDVTASPESIQTAVDQFEHPDVEAPKVANAGALGRKLRTTALPPSKVNVTVLNGNGVAGSAGSAAYALSQRGYKILEPPNGRPADAPAAYQTFHTRVFFDPAQAGSKLAAQAMQKLFQPADVAPLPKNRALRALDPGSMLIVVVGSTFHGDIAAVPQRTVQPPAPAYVRPDASAASLLQPLASRVPFKLMVPHVLERTSYSDREKPVRMYWLKKGQKGVRLTFRTGANEYWGIQETGWVDAPVLGDKSFRNVLNDGRTYDFYYSGSKLHMVVLHANGASYWVVNTLLDSLSNRTMIAIAKGLKPLGQ
jgi:LCP family protein required for cell wall assembly